MVWKVVLRTWPRGGINENDQPLEQWVASRHGTEQEADQAAEARALRFTYCRFDAENKQWKARNDEGLVFTITVEPQGATS